ncbi:hypothetical protein LJC03_01735 [Methanobrevibacter sp. OttesenSCG-928-I08]|nr:hypothetical protein [Methanobrevibacter sp. OttesenSCG-928-I08]
MSYKIHITSPLSSQKIIDLIDENSDLKLITCSQSLYDRIPQDYLDALKELSIDVKVEYNQGAKPKYEEEQEKILNLAKDNYSAREISEKLDIPIKRVYYLLSKNKENISFNNFNRKHDLKTRSLVKSLKDEGKTVKYISSKLNIPERSVYYILNNK